jgi:hypothetical protein
LVLFMRTETFNVCIKTVLWAISLRVSLNFKTWVIFRSCFYQRWPSALVFFKKISSIYLKNLCR